MASAEISTLRSQLIKKIITVSIDVDDPINIASNIDANLLKLARETYEGICWDGILIKRVLEIIMKNDLMCAQECDPDICTISLMLMVEGVVISEGDIIPNCEVISKNDVAKQILCKSSDATVITKLDSKFAAVDARGMFISVVVRNVKYCMSSSNISVDAVPWRPTKRYFVYKVTAKTPAATNERIDDLFKLLKTLNIKAITANPKILEALTPFDARAIVDNKTQTIGALKIVKIADLATMAAPYYVAKHSKLSPIDDRVAVYQVAENALDVDIGAVFENGVLSAADNPLESILHAYVNYLEFAIDLAEMFAADAGLAKSHAKILEIYNSYKDVAKK
ncbi:hypothetical protein F-VV10_0424 [Faustovirus]|nr:hypothetical protein F-VV10_0424 [Faustovirus]